MCETKHETFIGGGEMGERIRAFDWSQTALGAVEQWPQSLKTAVRIILASRYPMFVWWGRALTNFYNDAYAPILGKRHPDALGRPAADVWSDIWPVIRPQVDAVVNEGRSTWNEETLLVMERNGFTEETYFTFSYSPVYIETGEVGGLFCAVTEETGRVLSQRRMRTLRELAERTAQAKTAADACEVAAVTLEQDPHDLPFVLLYLLEGDGRWARLAGSSGVAPGTLASPLVLDVRAPEAVWPLCQAAEENQAVEVAGLAARFGPLPGGAWPESAQRAMVLPMAKPGQSQVAGFVVAGVSPRLPLTDEYQGFFTLLAGQVATAVAGARAYEDERRRAEALAEIDRAKTTFFSNVSHEFRTPLTLMLGPIEELLSHSAHELSPAAKGQLEVTHRNSLRLLRLVNTLLDFSRIEAGRVQAVFAPTDLAKFTAELVSMFHAATERAGLRLTIDCRTLSEPVYVDRDMWEKIVLNLVSNAFKFTFDGEIAVTFREADGVAELRVRDTGVGVPAEEIPKLFERFHRVPNMRSRTHEGSGIGLALVQELVRLNGGAVSVESRLGEGSTFMVTLPLGKAHLPAGYAGSARTQVSNSTGAAPFVEEALRWLPDYSSVEVAEPLPARKVSPSLAEPTGASMPRILIADDNADIRQYLARLLSELYNVETVADGEAALAAAREVRPDLILSDVMMPHLDGMGLVGELRADPRLRTIPVIMLSARAGEEARVDGLQKGADDYLIKPFSARELLARVASHLELARMRKQSEQAIRESEARYRSLFEHMLNGFAYCEMLFDAAGRPDDFVYLAVNDAFAQLTGLQNVVGKRITEVIPGVKEAQPELMEIYGRVASTGVPEKFEVDFKPLGIYLSISVYSPATGFFVAVFDNITERKRAEAALRESEERFRAVAETVPDILYVNDSSGVTQYVSRRFADYTGVEEQQLIRDGGLAFIHPDDVEATNQRWRHSIATGEPYAGEVRVRRRDGVYHWFLSRAYPMQDEQGRVIKWFGSATDIEDQKQIEKALRIANDDLNQFAYAAAHDLREPLRNVRAFSELLVNTCANGSDGRIGRMKAVIADGVQRMEDLLKDLLDYTRMASPGEEFTGTTNARAALEKALQNLEVVVASSGAEIVYGDLPTLAVGESHLLQLFQNLIANAIQYRNHERPRIVISATKRHGEWLFSVRDNGIGIAPEFHQKIFGLFKRLHGNDIPGTGLGLALCQRIVERYGGRIWVESDIGNGAEFFFTVPLSLSTVARAPFSNTVAGRE